MVKIKEEILDDFWKEISPEDRMYFENHLAWKTGTLKQNIEKGIEKIYNLYLGDPITIKKLKKEKELLSLSCNQKQDEINALKEQSYCYNCGKKGEYQTGGIGRVLFWWCSKECERKATLHQSDKAIRDAKEKELLEKEKEFLDNLTIPKEWDTQTAERDIENRIEEINKRLQELNSPQLDAHSSGRTISNGSEEPIDADTNDSIIESCANTEESE